MSNKRRSGLAGHWKKRCLMKTKLLALSVTLVLATLSIAQPQPAGEPAAQPPETVDTAPAPAPAVAPARREVNRTRAINVDAAPAQQRADAEMLLTRMADFQPYQQKMEKGSYI